MTGGWVPPGRFAVALLQWAALCMGGIVHGRPGVDGEAKAAGGRRRAFRGLGMLMAGNGAGGGFEGSLPHAGLPAVSVGLAPGRESDGEGGCGSGVGGGEALPRAAQGIEAFVPKVVSCRCVSPMCILCVCV